MQPDAREDSYRTASNLHTMGRVTKASKLPDRAPNPRGMLTEIFTIHFPRHSLSGTLLGLEAILQPLSPRHNIAHPPAFNPVR